MMLLNFSEAHKEHLSFFDSVQDEVLHEFCRISLEFITKGVTPKLYQTAAQKLDVEVSSVQNGVEGLMFLFIESSKLMLNEIDFHDSVMMLGYSEEKCQYLLSTYLENRQHIRTILSEMKLDTPHYFNLEWRFDVQGERRRNRMDSSTAAAIAAEKDRTSSVFNMTDPDDLTDSDAVIVFDQRTTL